MTRMTEMTGMMRSPLSSRSALSVFALILVMALTACQTVSNATPTPMPTVALPTARPTPAPKPAQTYAPSTLPAPKESNATPTPVVYRVGPGDTLIPIANKFGISVQELIEANANLDPTRLQIGQELVIPNTTVQLQATRALLPSPTPLPFTVRGLNVYRTAAGSLEVLGEVFNPGPNPIGNVQLLISLMDAGGKVLLSQPFFVALEVVPPSSTSPFRVLFADPPPSYATFNVNILRAENFSGNARYAKVSVTKNQGAPEGNLFHVTGEVTNTDVVTANLVRVIITTYDPDKKVIGYRYVQLNNDEALKPGAVTPFDITLLSSSPNVASYAVAAEAVK
ncbi:MAG: LysM peptidoglycan-binding domain-containing protein [Anaerolineae bacterium]|nr:LysM peptidoglycan-binding domain-containing protein [Thermoflexales bacterium]HQW35330.1 LysM peptidoglycan-binding domain-containing protein [Thermoflexales bacterium]